MRPGESPGLAKGYYLQRPESSLRAHGRWKEENYPQGDEGKKMRRQDKNPLPFSEEEFRNRGKVRTRAGMFLFPQSKEKEGMRNGEWRPPSKRRK